MGHNMGKGKGRGMGVGMGFGMTQFTSPLPQPGSLGQELEVLKAQSQAMAQQLNDIQQRIDELDKKRK